MKSERNSVKLILLNASDELALVLIDDEKVRGIDGKYGGSFWCMIGGKIESGETIWDAAERELFEETGIMAKDVEFGPEVWFGSVDLLINGVLTVVNQRFVVARTEVGAFDFSNLTENEKSTFQKIEWFSIDSLEAAKEPVYPASLLEHLPAVIAKNYPANPVKIRMR
ncbi:MAG: NUDIX domain-containing protein [Puniceicoccales bacterium]|nr:NUDIX domain-containing protein [Puniceicoccales bacterium]